MPSTAPSVWLPRTRSGVVRGVEEGRWSAPSYPNLPPRAPRGRLTLEKERVSQIATPSRVPTSAAKAKSREFLPRVTSGADRHKPLDPRLLGFRQGADASLWVVPYILRQEVHPLRRRPRARPCHPPRASLPPPARPAPARPAPATILAPPLSRPRSHRDFPVPYSDRCLCHRHRLVGRIQF